MNLAGDAQNGGHIADHTTHRQRDSPWRHHPPGDLIVSKTMSGLIVLPPDSPVVRRAQVSLEHMMNRARSACIQCSFCTQMCPRAMLGHPLQPHRMMRRLAACRDLSELLEAPEAGSAALCGPQRSLRAGRDQLSQLYALSTAHHRRWIPWSSPVCILRSCRQSISPPRLRNRTQWASWSFSALQRQVVIGIIFNHNGYLLPESTLQQCGKDFLGLGGGDRICGSLFRGAGGLR
mgnify:CR=1 FL=1